MECDVMLSHTMDDDITFERVRHMPRRTQFVSTHRKLSWQFDRQLKQHEKDQKLTHVEMARAKLAMAEKFSRLQDAKKEMERKKSDPSINPNRRSSAPSCLSDKRTDRKTTTTTTSPKGTATPMKHSHSASSFPVAAMIPEDAEMTEDQSDLKRVSFTEVSDKESGRYGRRATIAEGVVEASSLPPHLVRRLSEFMDSTSALLTNPASHRKGSAGSMPPQRQSDPGPLSRLAEQSEAETEVA
ncbi:hypothetical protein ACOMHN_014953 [Nucella lapillus]